MNEDPPKLASRGKRLGGALIDGVIAMAIIMPVNFLTGGFRRDMPIGQRAVYFVFAWGVFLALNGYLLFRRGQTIGKVLVKTRIVDLNGNIPSFGKLLVLRYLVLWLVESIPFIGQFAYIADVLFIFGNEQRCLHDYLAGTRVVEAA